MKITFLRQLLTVFLLFMVGMMSSCSETQIIEENFIDSKGDKLTFNISGPEILKSRASSDLLLRYTAKLFQGPIEGNPNGMKYLETKQTTADKDGKGTITFSVEPGKYQIIVFADYIKADAQADNNDLYTDVFYKTTDDNNPDRIELIGFSSFLDSSINNENFDCFYAETQVIDKTEEEHIEDLVLRRATAKVRFVSVTKNAANISQIRLNQFSYFKFLSLHSNAVTLQSFPISSTNFIFEALDNANNEEEEVELFYFYTLAPKNDNDNKLKDIKFTISFEGNSQPDRVFEIPAGTIPVIQNHVTTVKDAFLADRPKNLGDIILNLETSNDWDENEREIIIE